MCYLYYIAVTIIFCRIYVLPLHNFNHLNNHLDNNFLSNLKYISQEPTRHLCICIHMYANKIREDWKARHCDVNSRFTIVKFSNWLAVSRAFIHSSTGPPPYFVPSYFFSDDMENPIPYTEYPTTNSYICLLTKVSKVFNSFNQFIE